MLANEKGNMRDAYLAFERENDERVKYVQAELQKQGGFGAEIVPGTQAQWLIVVTMPGEEGVASGHLIARRFAVYQPRIPFVRIMRGRKVEGSRPMYPNYLFVHVWDVKRHARRILSCPGTHRLLTKEDGLTPVVVPWDVINDIRATENRQNPLTLRMDEVTGKARKRPRKNKKSLRKAILNADATVLVNPADLDVVGVHSWGFSRSMGTWDEEQAVSALHKALGLAA